MNNSFKELPYRHSRLFPRKELRIDYPITFQKYANHNNKEGSKSILPSIIDKYHPYYIQIIDVRGDGSCYYRAVFGSLLISILFYSENETKKIKILIS